MLQEANKSPCCLGLQDPWEDVTLCPVNFYFRRINVIHRNTVAREIKKVKPHSAELFKRKLRMQSERVGRKETIQNHFHNLKG